MCDSCGNHIEDAAGVTHFTGSSTGYYANDSVEFDFCTDCGEKFGMKRRGRRPNGASNGRSNGTTTTNRVRSSANTDTNAIREWAKENGFEVSERGRLSNEVMEAYRDRNKASAKAAKAASASVNGSPKEEDDPDADWED